MIFATVGLGIRKSHISILDLASHEITTLPESDGKFAPDWSPDGQFIKADSIDASILYIFDIKTQHWLALPIGPHAYALWSKDGRTIYFLKYLHDPAILRVPAAGGEAKVVVRLNGFPFTGTHELWFGLDPNDTPLMLRDVSTSDVYALTLEEK